MEVLVIVLCGSVHVGLARVAIRQGWTVLALNNAVQAMREIRDRSPRLVVVQVSMVNHEPLKLIRILRHSAQPVLVVAVAKSHRNQLEKLVRDAGAGCYLPGVDEEESLVQAVGSMLEYVPAQAVGGLAAGTLVRPERPHRVWRQGNKGLHR
jgi:DNA-binding NarL/FixJ family response regulator